MAMLLGPGTVGVAVGSIGIGIPYSVTKFAAGTGAHIVAVDLPGHQEEAQKLISEVRATGGKIDYFEADASKFEQMRQVFEAARRSGPIATVFSVAGRADPADNRLFPAIKAGKVMELLDQSINNNAKTALVSACLALEYMVQDGGGVIEFFDSLNSVADLGQFFYTTGKAPLSKWCRLISREFGQFGVRTYNLVIGTTPSKKLSWLKRFLEMVGLEKSLAWLFDTRRLGTPDDVAEMAINLATHNYWMSGTSIDLHGGYCGVNLTEDDDFRGTTHKLYQLLHGDEINPTHVVDAGGDAYAI